ncbi:MAG: putative addiction module antidote protein [Gammaproteobacteria bacterium RBG_16_57_12]|nr:MAG: putative addiction module antidote protein [Gammaproteobacteria bacterium RBG_16_57_12]
MTKARTTRYDLEACLVEANGDAAFIAKALGDIARAKGMSQVARDAGLSRESLYKALSGERSPAFDTILKVIEALGLKLHAQAALAATVRQSPLTSVSVVASRRQRRG